MEPGIGDARTDVFLVLVWVAAAVEIDIAVLRHAGDVGDIDRPHAAVVTPRFPAAGQRLSLEKSVGIRAGGANHASPRQTT